MNEARDQILAGIRRSLGRGPLTEDAALEARERLASRPRGTVPERTNLPTAELVELFVKKAQDVAATVARINALNGLPDAVAMFLAAANLPAAIRLAPDPDLTAIDWARRPTLDISIGRARGDELTSVTGAIVGVAETGTLLLASGPTSPTTLNFLPDNHIVVLRQSRIVGPLEEAWDRLRQTGPIPRTVNLITGPSRTGDIEQKIQLGAHGPRRLHIVLVDGSDE